MRRTASFGHVQVDEVHQRKGDTLLHLLCLNRPFNAEAAALFKHVAAKAPPPVFQKQNAIGLTFLDIAIDTLNFWVLTFVLKNFQVPGKALLCTGRAPLRRLLQAPSAAAQKFRQRPEVQDKISSCIIAMLCLGRAMLLCLVLLSLCTGQVVEPEVADQDPEPAMRRFLRPHRFHYHSTYSTYGGSNGSDDGFSLFVGFAAAAVVCGLACCFCWIPNVIFRCWDNDPCCRLSGKCTRHLCGKFCQCCCNCHKTRQQGPEGEKAQQKPPEQQEQQERPTVHDMT
eukprot:Skav224420  [mRNA]  locus=scaffold657:322838:327919:+ [translate_table: standard]